MKPIPYEVGRVVESTQGRDRGRLFVVISVVDDDFVLIADGDLRKVERPKRKKVKHLHAKPHLFSKTDEKLIRQAAISDSELRKALQAVKELTINKEGCGLVQE